MSLDVLDTLETRVREAADRLEMLRERNTELEARVAELEGELAATKLAPEAAGWEAERAELRRRVEKLIARLEGLLAG
jgi:FtsZ-binding cell division protein ZapB